MFYLCIIRLARDREKLPDFYEKRLVEEIRSIRVKEALLEEQQLALRIEDEKRRAAVDGLRAEVVKELDQGRIRLEIESKEMRSLYTFSLSLNYW